MSQLRLVVSKNLKAGSLRTVEQPARYEQQPLELSRLQSVSLLTRKLNRLATAKPATLAVIEELVDRLLLMKTRTRRREYRS